MLSYRLGTVNDFHWEFKPVLSYSKPHTFSTFFFQNCVSVIVMKYVHNINVNYKIAINLIYNYNKAMKLKFL